jgi:hypothetical protein
MPNPIREYGIENSTAFSVKSFNILFLKNAYICISWKNIQK